MLLILHAVECAAGCPPACLPTPLCSVHPYEGTSGAFRVAGAGEGRASGGGASGLGLLGRKAAAGGEWLLASGQRLLAVLERWFS